MLCTANLQGPCWLQCKPWHRFKAFSPVHVPPASGPAETRGMDGQRLGGFLHIWQAGRSPPCNRWHKILPPCQVPQRLRPSPRPSCAGLWEGWRWDGAPDSLKNAGHPRVPSESCLAAAERRRRGNRCRQPAQPGENTLKNKSKATRGAREKNSDESLNSASLSRSYLSCGSSCVCV